MIVGHLLGAAGTFGEHLDHFAAHECRVDVHDDEPLRPAVQPTALNSDIDLEQCGLRIQFGTQEIGVRTGHVHLDAGHRVTREPHDAVDIRAVAGNTAGDTGHGRRQQRVAQDRDVQRAGQRGGVDLRSDRHLDLKPEVACGM